jgi:hypothetical protein
MAYEDGMSFQHNAILNRGTVMFRGKKTVLSGQYDTYQQVKEAAEEYCRKNGWQG